ncbi:class I SAM-dependent methyltransferase [Candidatus Parcubacteria bacterium]|nr:MAG: class I SAM-dependent methyltransferase [Candidatus Parcubacteria bacterium]
MRYFIDRDEWLKKIRDIEFEVIFKDRNNISKRFCKVLDLGAGEGFSSLRLSVTSDVVVAVDFDKSRLDRIKSTQINKVVCDAEILCFKKKEFDLVLVSNLLEHLPDINHILRNIYTILNDNGILIITVPSRAWKILNMLFFYPNQLGIVAKSIFMRSKTEKSKKVTNNIKSTYRYGFLRRNIFPIPHGCGNSSLHEMYNWGIKRWLRKFANNNLIVIDVIDRLPLYSGYPLAWEDSVLSPLSILGLTSSYAFVLKKKF